MYHSPIDCERNQIFCGVLDQSRYVILPHFAYDQEMVTRGMTIGKMGVAGLEPATSRV